MTREIFNGKPQFVEYYGQFKIILDKDQYRIFGQLANGKWHVFKHSIGFNTGTRSMWGNKQFSPYNDLDVCLQKAKAYIDEFTPKLLKSIEFQNTKRKS